MIIALWSNIPSYKARQIWSGYSGMVSTAFYSSDTVIIGPFFHRSIDAKHQSIDRLIDRWKGWSINLKDRVTDAKDRPMCWFKRMPLLRSIARSIFCPRSPKASGFLQDKNFKISSLKTRKVLASSSHEKYFQELTRHVLIHIQVLARP